MIIMTFMMIMIMIMTMINIVVMTIVLIIIIVIRTVIVINTIAYTLYIYMWLVMVSACVVYPKTLALVSSHSPATHELPARYFFPKTHPTPRV